MDLTQMTEAAFLCDGARTEDVENPLAFELGLAAISNWPRTLVRQLNPDYALHALLGQPGDVVLTFQDEIVGFYFGESLAIVDAHQGKSLGTPMILAAAPLRSVPFKRIVSNAGEAALRKAWRVANQATPDPWP